MKAMKQKERDDRKRESNGNPEIPDRRVTSDIPDLHSGLQLKINTKHVHTLQSSAGEATHCLYNILKTKC